MSSSSSTAAPSPTRGPASQYEVVLCKGACGFGIYFTAAADGTAVVDPTTPFYRLPDDAPAPGEACGEIASGDRLLAINGTNIERWRFSEVVDELRRTPLGDATLRFQRARMGVDDDHGDDDDHDDDIVPPLEMATDVEADMGTADGRSTANGDASRLSSKRVRWKLFDWPTPSSTTGAAVPPTSWTSAAVTTPTSSPHGGAMNRSAAMEELLVEMENRLHALEDAVEREKKCRFLAEKKNILYRNALGALSEENAQLRHALAAETRAREATQRFQHQKLQLRI